MSRNVLRIFLSAFGKELLTPKIVLAGTACHLTYTLCTKHEKDIIVAKKYQYDTHGFTNFMIVDTTGHHYNVNNSVWFFKWDSIEDWSKVEPNNNLAVKYYGWRIPFLGTFPNIYKVEYKIDTAANETTKSI